MWNLACSLLCLKPGKHLWKVLAAKLMISSLCKLTAHCHQRTCATHHESLQSALPNPTFPTTPKVFLFQFCDVATVARGKRAKFSYRSERTVIFSRTLLCFGQPPRTQCQNMATSIFVLLWMWPTKRDLKRVFWQFCFLKKVWCRCEISHKKKLAASDMNLFEHHVMLQKQALQRMLVSYTKIFSRNSVYDQQAKEHKESNERERFIMYGLGFLGHHLSPRCCNRNMLLLLTFCCMRMTLWPAASMRYLLSRTVHTLPSTLKRMFPAGSLMVQSPPLNDSTFLVTAKETAWGRQYRGATTTTAPLLPLVGCCCCCR